MRNTQLSAALLLFAVAGSAGAHDLFVAFSKPGTAAGEANTALVNNGTFDEQAALERRILREAAQIARHRIGRERRARDADCVHAGAHHESIQPDAIDVTLTEGTQAREATPEELQHDHIALPAFKAKAAGHTHHHPPGDAR